MTCTCGHTTRSQHNSSTGTRYRHAVNVNPVLHLCFKGAVGQRHSHHADEGAASIQNRPRPPCRASSACPPGAAQMLTHPACHPRCTSNPTDSARSHEHKCPTMLHATFQFSQDNPHLALHCVGDDACRNMVAKMLEGQRPKRGAHCGYHAALLLSCGRLKGGRCSFCTAVQHGYPPRC